jgi:hypothetical protein
MTENSIPTRGIEHGLSLLEKATQFRWSLFLTSFILASDTALNVIKHQGILSFSWHSFFDSSSSSFFIPTGSLLAFLGAYMFFMAGISPLIQYLVERFFWNIRLTSIGLRLSTIFHGKEQKNTRSMYSNGYVHEFDAKTQALRDKDNFWISRIETIEKNRARDEAENGLTGRVSFSCGLLLLLNYLLTDQTSITGLIEKFLAQYGRHSQNLIELFILVCVGLLLFPWLYWYLSDRYSNRWIEHPALAEQELNRLLEQEKKNREFSVPSNSILSRNRRQ